MIAALSPLVFAALSGGWNNVAAAYAVTIVAVAAYAVFVILRGRKVTRQLPPEDRRWM